MSNSSTVASVMPSTRGGEDGRLSRSASHTAAPSVVSDQHRHDDPTSAAYVKTDPVAQSSGHQRPSAVRPHAAPLQKQAPHRKRDKATQRGPLFKASGSPPEMAQVARCDVVFSQVPPPSVMGTSGLSASVAPTATASGQPGLKGASRLALSSGAQGTVRVHRVNHPHGFRILKDTSAIERSMKTYFRLPPAPNMRLQQERERIHKELLRVERMETRELRRVANGGGVLLDGFLLLSAAEVEDPDEVEAVTLQSSHLVGSVAEDLAYFQNLFFLDVSENELRLEDLLSLENLETLHLAYNRVASLAGLDAYIQTEKQQEDEQWCGTGAGGSGDAALPYLTEAATLGGTATSKSSVLHGVLLPGLQALNLSYNTVPFTELPYLACFPCLEKLDLSGNNLRRLPADLSLLASVTHLALENNGFTSGGENDVFLPLSSMPSLQEVNLNNNAISSIPVLSVQDGRGLCFPCIETIGLSENKFRRAEALLPLASLHRSLRRVVLSKNPLSTDTALTRRTRQLFDQTVVDAYYERVFTTPSARAPHNRVGGEGPHGMDTPEDDATNRSTATAGASSPGVPGPPLNADDAMWKGESWSRFIPSSSEQTEAGAGTAEESGASTMHRSPAAVDATPLTHSTHSGTTASRPAYGTQTTEMLTAEEYFYGYRVELVFDEFKMPKQSLRHFYSTGLREGGQNTLVTIPDYKEFMDIYRITGRKKTSWKTKLPSSTVNGAAKAGPGHTRPVFWNRDEARAAQEEPEDVADDVQDDDEGEHEASPLPADSPESDAGGPHTVTTSEDVAFFMTEMNDEPFVAAPKPTPPQKPALPAPVEPADHQSAPSGRRRRDPIQPAGTVNDNAHTQRSKRTGHLPASVVSPASTNVHAAMHELRAILRKPLPPLPYGVNGGKGGGQHSSQSNT